MYVVESRAKGAARRAASALAAPLPSRLLAAIAVDHAGVVDVDTIAEPARGERLHRRIALGATHDVWLIRWGPGSGTEMHDHGGSAGALYVVGGSLDEVRPGRRRGDGARYRRLGSGSYRLMEPAHVHAVTNAAHVVATSVHVYSPPLTSMQHFDAGATGGLRATHREIVDRSTLTHE